MPGLFDNVGQNGGLLGMLTGHPGSLASSVSPGLYGRQFQLQGMQAAYEAYKGIPGVTEPMARALALSPDTAKELLPQFGQIGQNEWGQNIYGFHNPLTQSVNPVNPSGTTGIQGQPSQGPAAMQPQPQGPQGGISETGNPELTGEAYLATVPQSFRDIIRKMAGYQADPKNLGYKDNIRTRLIAAAHQYDPTYDETAFPARSAAAKEFVAGGNTSPAGNITAGNTAIAHGGKLLDLSDKLGGTNAAGPANFVVNKANQLYQEAKQNPDLSSYETLADKFTEEMTKFYRNTGGNEADIQRGLEQLSAAHSPEARKAAISTLIAAADAKVNQLQHRWRTAMGDTGWKQTLNQLGPQFNLYSPETAGVVQRAHTNLGGQQQGQPAVPNVGDVYKGHKFLGGNPADPRSWQKQ